MVVSEGTVAIRKRYRERALFRKLRDAEAKGDTP